MLGSLLLLTQLALALPSQSEGPALQPGDAAPALQVKEWVKGEPVKNLARDRVHVLVFWNTWSKVSQTCIPRLTELQKLHADVIFMGVSVYEHELDQRMVASFVKRMGDRMGYRVALDDVPDGQKTDQGAMWKTWMLASGTTTVPTAFVVDKSGKIAWIGNAGVIDQVLENILAGKWDTAAFRKQKAEDDVWLAAAFKLQDEIDAAIKAGNTKPMIAAIDEAITRLPRLEALFGSKRFEFLLEAKEYVAAYAYASRLVDGALKDDATKLNNIAWSIVGPENKDLETRDLKLALRAALRSNELTKGKKPGVLDTLAKVYFESGDTAKAIEIQTQAVELAKDDPEALKEFQGRLDEYKKGKPAGK